MSRDTRRRMGAEDRVGHGGGAPGMGRGPTPGRRGQAPKGTGGMPRRHQQSQAWKAARCPGERPNARRSRNSCGDPGN